ncbi:transposable element p transposase [Plakobranchus ocellatus]|uniref:Transposable element p transposase n=1 Tax=Plakobranchus ocellatus TaxID=259542 RepID=A0AAV4BVM9_9GAST|nr:transposable element p transposase [Plakobranchus ocellatus]
MDQLFNAFNSCSRHSNQKMWHAMSLTSGHIEFVEATRQWLPTLHSKSKKGDKRPCMEDWQIAINSLLMLWEDLQKTQEVKFLRTSGLNQDCVENLSSTIRGHRDNPVRKSFVKVCAR